MNLECPEAFEPFFDETAVITGQRRESGASASRELKLAVPCCVMGGEVSDQGSFSAASTNERAWSVLIRRADWPDHLPPQIGDLCVVDSFPSMRIKEVLPFGKDQWSVSCRSKEAVQ